MQQYFKNFILCGEIDFFCLLCHESFITTKDVDVHICWEEHRSNVKRQEQMEKFGEKAIHKIGDHFYCELCNFVTDDPKEHKSTEKHINEKENKNESPKKLRFVIVENDVIKIYNYTITKLQWHGISKGTCSVCDETVEQPSRHIKVFHHMVNLIQSPIKFENSKCYRELKGDTFHCLTCCNTYDTSSLKIHLNMKCDENVYGSSVNSSCMDHNNNSKVEILSSIYEKNFEIDVENKTALCLACKETVHTMGNSMSMHQLAHMEDKNGVWLGWYFDHGKRRSELAKYGRENYINLNERGCTGYCTLCDITISAHIDIARQHVQGALHKGFLELKGLVKEKTKHVKTPCKVISYKSFLKEAHGPYKIDEYTVIYINGRICIDFLSFIMIKEINNFKCTKNKCFACDVEFQCNYSLHITSIEHSNKLLACKVLLLETDGYEEFIREIRPGLYHCGLCNTVCPYWETMQKHLKSFPHKLQRGKKKNLLNPIICPI